MGHGETESVSLLRLWKNCTQRRYLSLVEEDQAAAMDVQNSAEIEPEPTHLELGIRIEKLTKVCLIMIRLFCPIFNLNETLRIVPQFFSC